MVVVGVFVAVSAGRVIYADFLSPESRLKRALAGRRRVPIAEAQEGPVRMTGRARQVGDLLRAPVSQRPCIAFHLVIEERGVKYDWQKVLELTDARPFMLVDESGTALVETVPGLFSLALVPDRRGSRSIFGSNGDEMKRVRALLGSTDVSTETMFGLEKTFRFSEGALLQGAHVSVGGQCAREIALDGDGATYREPPQRLVVRATAEERLLISNWRETREKPGAE